MRNTLAILLAAATTCLTAFAGAPPATAQEPVSGSAAANAPAQEAGAAARQERPAGATPGIAGTTVLLAGDIARLELEMTSGETHEIELNSGHVVIDGRRRGTYETGGALDRAWRELLRNPAIGETATLPELLAGWDPPTPATGDDGRGRSAVLEALERYAPGTGTTVQAEQAPGQGAQVTIVPRAGSIGQLAERLRELNETLDRISGDEFELDGDFALVVHDDHRIAEGTTITGDVALLSGRLTVAGDIDGDLLVLGGDLRLEPGSLVTGDVRSLGGEVETTGATIVGEILSLSAVERVANEAAAEARAAERERRDERRVRETWDEDRGGPGVFGGITRAISRTVSDLVGTVVWLIALTLVGAGFVYFAPTRLEAVATEARTDVLRSFGVGLAGQLLFFPILLLLVVMIVTWLVVPFYVIAVALAVPAGYIAVARGLGEVVVDRDYDLFDRFNLNRQNTYYYVLNGLIVLLAPFAVAAVLQLLGDWFGFLRGLLLFVGIVLAWATATTGFGAVILTRGGGLVRSIPSFRRKRSVPLDDLRPDPPAEGAGGDSAAEEPSDA